MVRPTIYTKMYFLIFSILFYLGKTTSTNFIRLSLSIVVNLIVTLIMRIQLKMIGNVEENVS